MPKSRWLLVVVFILSACVTSASDQNATVVTPTSLPTDIPIAAAPPVRAPGVFFDDFSYTQQPSMIANGWIIRTAPGWPGVSNAVWTRNSVSFVDDADQPGNRLVRMTSSTNGTAARQTQFCQQRKYLAGTYAARVRFTDRPVSGPGGDQIVQTFYLISPLQAPLDPDYSEIDIEYLPNGGWGSDQSVHLSSWETFSPEPDWKMDNASDTVPGSLAGWHTLVIQVADQQVKYYIDDVLRAAQGGKYYPEVPMSINFNLWFIRDGLINAEEIREYVEDIDWAYFAEQQTLSPQQIEAQIKQLRAASVNFADTVPVSKPPLVSPCDF